MNMCVSDFIDVGSLDDVPVRGSRVLRAPGGDIEKLSVEEADWSDSCLGLGGPAESCLAVITPGYRMEFVAGGEEGFFVEFLFDADEALEGFAVGEEGFQDAFPGPAGAQLEGRGRDAPADQAVEHGDGLVFAEFFRVVLGPGVGLGEQG